MNAGVTSRPKVMNGIAMFFILLLLVIVTTHSEAHCSR
jgi:hypothetical protein